MKTFCAIITGSLLSIQLSFCQSNASFESILSEISNSPKTNNNGIIERFIKDNKQIPVVENNTIIFLAKADVDGAPRLVSDFNGFMNRRYVKDSTLANMTAISTTDWHFSKYVVEPDAIINYQFVYGDESMNDPLNPNLRINFGSPISFIQMSKDQVFEEGLRAFSSGQGQLIQEEFESKILNQTRKIHVYLPFQYHATKSYPSTFFHDGSFFITEGNIPTILDNLISTKQIQPMIAIFDDPGIRGKEYRNDPDFRNYIKNELLPYVNKKFNTSDNSNQRAVIGFSRGGMSSLYLSHSLEEFSMCGAFSPAIHPKPINEFQLELGETSNKPKTVYITRSTYDKIWQQDAVDLKTYFEKNADNFSYKEINAGHNLSAWRTMLDDMLISFFPTK